MTSWPFGLDRFMYCLQLSAIRATDHTSPDHALLKAHQTTCFAVHDLCLHPEYIVPLRKELESPQWAAFERTGKGLPLLDSFIKESARTIHVESSKLPS